MTVRSNYQIKLSVPGIGPNSQKFAKVDNGVQPLNAACGGIWSMPESHRLQAVRGCKIVDCAVSSSLVDAHERHLSKHCVQHVHT